NQNLKVQKQAVKLAEETHTLTKARLESGKGNVLDTLNSRYSLQRALFAFRDAEKNRYMATKQMLTIASMNANPDSVELTDSLAVIDFTLSEEEAIKIMSTNNTLLKKIENGLEIQQMQIEITKCDFLPTLYAGAAVSKIAMFDNYDKDSWGDDQKVFVGATIPIYSGGQKLQKVRQATFEKQSLTETKAKTLRQLTLALENYFEELAVAREECKEALHLISLTEQGVEIASLSYEIGQITQNDLTQSKQQLSMSQLAYNSAVYKLNVAIAGIKTLLGEESLLSVKAED
ncbi:MAG: TolC family protein, partial [Fibrobacter sp.]|nr:TolC family protein [Fibrobacter sp.]